MRDKVLIFSDRISSEILIKAAKIDVEIILSKSALLHLQYNLQKIYTLPQLSLFEKIILIVQKES